MFDDGVGPIPVSLVIVFMNKILILHNERMLELQTYHEFIICRVNLFEGFQLIENMKVGTLVTEEFLLAASLLKTRFNEILV